MTNKPDRLLRLPGLQELVPLARSVIYTEMERGFPRPVKITSATGKSAAVAWSENEVLAWIERTMAERRAAPPIPAAAAAHTDHASQAIEPQAFSNDAGEA